MSRASSPTRLVKTSVQLPQDLLTEIDHEAAERNVSRSVIVIEALRAKSNEARATDAEKSA